MLIEPFSAKEVALRAAQNALSGSDALDADAKELVANAIASAVEAAFDSLSDMQIDEARRRF